MPRKAKASRARPGTRAATAEYRNWMGRRAASIHRVCFVTGTRAEFGLMQSTLRAIANQPLLGLQVVVTGMHLDARHGKSADLIWTGISATVRWPAGKGAPLQTATSTGRAIASLAKTFNRLKSDIVLVVGDRVEAFAAASAAHISGRIVAHIHGGDRALGQVDDSLRHAITKLAHVHFAATKQSANRIARLGEDKWRIHAVGAPGIDGILEQASPARIGKGWALLVLHPINPNDRLEFHRAKLLLDTVKSIPFERIVIIHPNNDPGSRGIARCWEKHARGARFVVHRNVARPQFLGLLRDAAVLVGNSSSGIIEAASFGTPVIDVGPRQLGRERSGNVTNVPYTKTLLLKALRKVWNSGRPKRFDGRNAYGGNGAGVKIANVLSSLPPRDRLWGKLIAY
jgi:GDP/UDP-N,N'-diacetylbacillosamine 2-epimerase (hydrolysing)